MLVGFFFIVVYLIVSSFLCFGYFFSVCLFVFDIIVSSPHPSLSHPSQLLSGFINCSAVMSYKDNWAANIASFTLCITSDSSHH